MAQKSALTKKKKTGYAFGIFTESLIYNMFYTYYLTFLNEIVGIQPKYSSIIIFVSIAWDAVTDPMIGNYTDRAGVDKRKVMKKALFPLAIWVFYTMYTIPYYAVVAEITEDYDERTQIRSFSSLLNAIAVGLGNILPALVPTVALLLTEKYESNAYAVVAAIISVMAVVLGFVSSGIL